MSFLFRNAVKVIRMDKKSLLNELTENYRLKHKKSEELFKRTSRYQVKGGSHNLRLFYPFPFYDIRCFGSRVKDVDGNTYIDFSAGIYTNSVGHCHPKVVEKTKEYVGKLMNCHDFTTPIKAMFLEKLAGVLPGDLKGIQLFCAGTEAVEGALRAVRTIKKGNYEIFSFWGDWHGKTSASMSLSASSGERLP